MQIGRSVRRSQNITALPELLRNHRSERRQPASPASVTLSSAREHHKRELPICQSRKTEKFRTFFHALCRFAAAVRVTAA